MYVALRPIPAPEPLHVLAPTRPTTFPRPTRLADGLWPLLEAGLFQREGDDRTFNPWRDEDPALDVEGAAPRRRANLRAYLDAFPEAPPVVLVGEAPSWRGCRFSGVAFTPPVRARRPCRVSAAYRAPPKTPDGDASSTLYAHSLIRSFTRNQARA